MEASIFSIVSQIEMEVEQPISNDLITRHPNNHSGAIHLVNNVNSVNGIDDPSTPNSHENTSTTTPFSEDDDDVVDILWDEDSEVFIHTCGMKYDPWKNTYFIEVSFAPNVLRSLFFIPIRGELKCAN